jgi:hypothetical protein
MLNEHEQRTLAEIESTLGVDDPAFVRRFAGTVDPPSRQQRLWVAIVIGVAGLVGAFLGLRYTSVPTAVVAICTVGVAGAVWTWPLATSRRPR